MINKSKKPIHWLRLFTVITLVGGSALVLKSCTEEKHDQTGEQAKTVQSEIETADFKNVEVNPEFPGGQKELINYLSKNIVYPEAAKSDGVSGVVYCSFVIDKDGSISNVKVLKGLSPELDQAAKDAIANMPDWDPAIHKDGQAVAVEFKLPVRYQLDDNIDNVKKEK